MKTKAVSLALSALMALASFASCSKANDPAPVRTEAPITQQHTAAPASDEPTGMPSAERPEATESPTQTAQPTSAPTAVQTAAPTAKPTAAPSAASTQRPTAAPTPRPTTAPTQKPTAAPTPAPTSAPTPAPHGLREGKYTGEIEKFVEAMNSTVRYDVTITFRGGHYDYSVHVTLTGGMSHETDEIFSGDYTVSGSNISFTGRLSSGVISGSTISLTGYLSSFSGSQDTVDVVFGP